MLLLYAAAFGVCGAGQEPQVSNQRQRKQFRKLQQKHSLAIAAKVQALRNAAPAGVIGTLCCDVVAACLLDLQPRDNGLDAFLCAWW